MRISALLLAAALPIVPASAEVRALVIGIDDYHHGTSLHGAVADANDIARALRAIGVADLTIRLNDEAKKGRLSQDWNDLVERANPGDTLIITYAGHGAQEPERVPGNEVDGKDEVLLLGGFENHGEGTRERILDDELNQWFEKASAKGAAILFLADACHSGTLTRGVDARVGKPTYRYASYDLITDDMLELDVPPEVGSAEPDSIPHLTFLAAAQEYETVPEVSLYDADWHRAQRGALSWAFSRALEGQADENGDGLLTRGEINHFVRANVRVLAEARQTPNLLPPTDSDHVILPIKKRNADESYDADEWPVARVRILDNSDEAASALKWTSGINVVTDAQADVDLVLDLQTGQAIAGQGDILARNLQSSSVPSVIEKWRSLERLKLERLGDRLDMRLFPDDGTHRQRQEIGFEIRGLRLPYLVFFSLSGDGMVHFHYPLEGDPETVSIHEPVTVRFNVTPPFGSDHIIAVTSDQPLDTLSHALANLDGTRASGDAVRAVLNVTQQGQRQLGIQGLYTAP